jgi:hypothetical protein
MERVHKYMVVSKNDPNKLNTIVNELLENGWELNGPPSTAGLSGNMECSANVIYSQSLVMVGREIVCEGVCGHTIDTYDEGGTICRPCRHHAEVER